MKVAALLLNLLVVVCLMLLSELVFDYGTLQLLAIDFIFFPVLS